MKPETLVFVLPEAFECGNCAVEGRPPAVPVKALVNTTEPPVIRFLCADCAAEALAHVGEGARL